MSVVSTYLLLCSVAERHEIADDEGVSAFLEQLNGTFSPPAGFTALNKAFGGGKSPLMMVFGYSTKFLAPEVVVPTVLGLSWQEPDAVMLIVQSEMYEQYRGSAASEIPQIYRVGDVFSYEAPTFTPAPDDMG